MFEVTVTEIGEAEGREITRYRQIVDDIDQNTLNAIIAAVNRRPRKQRTPKAKANGNE